MNARPLPRRRRGSRLGFTIIELLVVIAIIIILAALVAPLLTKGVRQAKGVRCTANLKQIGAAYMNYLKDYGMRFPIYGRHAPVPPQERLDWTAILLPYIPNREIFLCPSRPPVYQSNPERGIQFPINYGISNGAYGKKYTRIADLDRTGVVADAYHDRFYTSATSKWGLPQIIGSTHHGVPDQRVHVGHRAGLLYLDWHAELREEFTVDLFLPD